ncbi:MAG: hypothetical protein CMC82_01620 [Flavobacteriaceae bacterium]|nr:hypothetical protein [Flavobacteriaceae bacterium]
MKVRPFQRTTEASFPENESLPQKEQDEKQFNKNFADWWDEVKENLARLDDQLSKYIKADLVEAIDENRAISLREVSKVTKDAEENIQGVATVAEGADAGIQAHVADFNNPHSVTPDQLNLATIATSGNYSDLGGVPLTFAPSAHNHAISEVSLLQEALNGKASSAHVHGNISNDGKVGATPNKPLITTTAGAVTTGAFGTIANSFCEGNDSRLSDTRTPKSHAHGNISNDGRVGATSNKPLITTTAGAVTTGSFGTSANSFCQGNDSRLSDTRAPTAHSHAISEITNLQNTLSTIPKLLGFRTSEITSATTLNVPLPTGWTHGKPDHVQLTAVNGENNFAGPTTVSQELIQLCGWDENQITIYVQSDRASFSLYVDILLLKN